MPFAGQFYFGYQATTLERRAKNHIPLCATVIRARGALAANAPVSSCPDMNPFDLLVVVNGIHNAVQRIADYAINSAHSRVHQRIHEERSYVCHDTGFPLFYDPHLLLSPTFVRMSRGNERFYF
jgi:hypothetical protein